MTRRLLYAVGILLAVALAIRIVLLVTKPAGDGTGTSGSRPPVAVEVDSVRTGPIREVRQLTGTVHPENRYVVSPKLSGRLLRIHKRIGDPVRRGEVLAELDAAEVEQSVREAEANLRIAQAALAEAESQFALSNQELERAEALREEGLVSNSDFDAVVTQHRVQQSRLDLARGQVSQREAALGSARIRLDYTRLTAAEPGFIGERFVDEGALLAANAPVLSVVGIEEVLVRTTIIERDYGRLSAGQEATVEVDAFPGRAFAGRVARIAPLLEEASRTAQVEVEVANDSLLLKPGMFARVGIVLEERALARLVPTRAVVEREGRRSVFVVDAAAKVARHVPIEAGIVTPEQTEVLAPAIEGLIVTLGQHLLADGGPVVLPSPRARGGGGSDAPAPPAGGARP